MTTHKSGWKGVLGLVVAIILFFFLVWETLYFVNPHYNKDCLLATAKSVCIEFNMTYGNNSLFNYAGSDFFCYGETDLRTKTHLVKKVYFLDKEKLACKIKEAWSFK